MTIRFLADDIAERQVSDAAAARALAGALRATGRYEEVVSGLDRVAVQFDPLRLDPDRIASDLGQDIRGTEDDAGAEPVTLTVRYGGEDGPDLCAVAEAAGLTPEALIVAHTEGVHLIEMMGFTPGFAYLSGLDDRVTARRLTTPRMRVAPGSVGVIAGHTGLYALGGPGGWPLVGRVTETLFDPGRADPFLLRTGQRVRFTPA